MTIDFEALERGVRDSGKTPMPLELIGKTLFCFWVVYRKEEGQQYVSREAIIGLIEHCAGNDMPKLFKRALAEGYVQERMTSGIVSGYLAAREVGSDLLCIRIDGVQATHLIQAHERLYPDEVGWIRSRVVPHLCCQEN